MLYYEKVCYPILIPSPSWDAEQSLPLMWTEGTLQRLSFAWALALLLSWALAINMGDSLLICQFLRCHTLA